MNIKIMDTCGNCDDEVICTNDDSGWVHADNTGGGDRPADGPMNTGRCQREEVKNVLST